MTGWTLLFNPLLEEGIACWGRTWRYDCTFGLVALACGRSGFRLV